MDESPTEAPMGANGLFPEPTVEAPVEKATAEPTQETNSQAPAEESVSDDTATPEPKQPAEEPEKQTEPKGGEAEPDGTKPSTDDGLAKFAKGQGIEDVSDLTEREMRILKTAHDNQKAFRERSTPGQESVSDVTRTMSDGSLEAEIAELRYENTTNKFWNSGNDRSMEPTMIEILNEKVEELTPHLGEDQAKAYAFSLSRDLSTLYGMAQMKSGALGKPVDADAIRREERESIKRQTVAGAPAAHAVAGGNEGKPKVTRDWISNVYDPGNPEHIIMMQEAGLR